MVCGGPLSDGGPTRSLIRDHYFESSTLVKLCELDQQIIDSYVATGEPLLVLLKSLIIFSHNINHLCDKNDRYHPVFYQMTF